MMKAGELQRIRDEADYAFASRKRYRQMDEFEQMITWPAAQRLFAVRAPAYVVELLKHIDKLEAGAR